MLSVHEAIKFRIRIISHVKVQETVKSQMLATTRLLTWLGRLLNTAHPYNKSISIIKMYFTNNIDSWAPYTVKLANIVSYLTNVHPDVCVPSER